MAISLTDIARSGDQLSRFTDLQDAIAIAILRVI